MKHSWKRVIADLEEFAKNLENGVPIEATQVQRNPDGSYTRRHVVLNVKITPEEFHRQVAAVHLDKVPIMTTERCIPRKDQAKLARQLFKQPWHKGSEHHRPELQHGTERGNTHSFTPRLHTG